MHKSLIWLSALAALTAGCTNRATPEGLQADALRYDEGTNEAELILRAANELDYDTLRWDVGLRELVTLNIIDYRDGDDDLDGTADDTPYVRLIDLDDVPRVKEATMNKLLAYAEDLWSSGGAVHGYLDGTPEAEAILSVANTESHHALEHWAGLSDLASCNIYEGRVGADGIAGTDDDTVYATLAELDAVLFVDGHAFDAMVEYGGRLEGPDDCPEGFILSSDGVTMFTDLESAMENSPEGTVLDVCAGTFADADVYTNSVVLRGRGVGVTVIERASTSPMIRVQSGQVLTLESLTFDGSPTTSSSSGGAIYVYSGGELIAEDVLFSDFYASNGGAIYSQGPVTLTGVTFEDNYVYDNGGAIYMTGGVPLTMSDVTFTNNTAADHGGAIYYYGASETPGISLSAGSFVGNSASDYGGAIYSYYGDNSVVDTEFSGNTGYYGGAIYGYQTTYDMDSVLVHQNASNVAEGGGGYYLTGSLTSLVATDMDFGWLETDNSNGDVSLGAGNVFYYGDGVSITCDSAACVPL